MADPLSKRVISSIPSIIGLLHSLHTAANLAVIVNDLLLLLAEVPVYVLEGVLCELLFRGNVLDKCLGENGVALLGGVCGGVKQMDVSENLLGRALGLMSRPVVLFVTGDL